MEHKVFLNDTTKYHVHGSLIPQLGGLDSRFNIPLESQHHLRIVQHNFQAKHNDS